MTIATASNVGISFFAQRSFESFSNVLTILTNFFTLWGQTLGGTVLCCTWCEPHRSRFGESKRRQYCRTRRMFVARPQSCPAKTMAPKSLESCWMQARGTEGPFLTRSREAPKKHSSWSARLVGLTPCVWIYKSFESFGFGIFKSNLKRSNSLPRSQMEQNLFEPPDYLSPTGAKVELSDSNGDTALSSALRLHLNLLLTVENPRVKDDPSSIRVITSCLKLEVWLNHSARLSEATELSNQIKALAASKCRLFHKNASTTQFWCTLQHFTAKTYLTYLLCKFFNPFFPPAFYLHFARTRRRHPMEVGAACAAAGAAGLHLAGEARNIRLWDFLSFFRYVLRVRHKLLKRRNHQCMAALRLQPCELFWEFAPQAKQELPEATDCPLAGRYESEIQHSLECSRSCMFHIEADLFRADVEQAIGASSAVQDRLIVVWLGYLNTFEHRWKMLGPALLLVPTFLQSFSIFLAHSRSALLLGVTAHTPLGLQ